MRQPDGRDIGHLAFEGNVVVKPPSWIKVLQNDKRAVFQAAAHAQRAVDYLHGLQPSAARPETIAARGLVMTLPRTIIIGGKSYDWREIRALRKAKLEAHRAAQAAQPTLFPLVTDCRPQSQCTASGRFSQPTLFDPPGRP